MCSLPLIILSRRETRFIVDTFQLSRKSHKTYTVKTGEESPPTDVNAKRDDSAAPTDNLHDIMGSIFCSFVQISWLRRRMLQRGR